MEKGMYAEMAELEKGHWWFQGRRHVVFDLMHRYAPQGRLLDVGLGTGFNAQEFIRRGYGVDGLEPSEDAIVFAQRAVPSVNIIQSRFPASTIASDSYDVVTLLDVVEHLEDDGAALRDVHRILKQGGTAFITVPAFQFLWTKHDERAHHFRRYRKTELRRIITGAGLQPVFVSYYNFFLFPLIALVRVVTKMARREEGNDFDKTPNFLNRVLAWIFSSERFLLRIIALPFGVSLIAVVRKL